LRLRCGCGYFFNLLKTSTVCDKPIRMMHHVFVLANKEHWDHISPVCIIERI